MASATESSEGSTAPSVFRSFAAEHFLAWGSWKRIGRILEGNGGSFGLAGPRGAGKTWAMLKAQAVARGRGGIGLWFPSPSEYEPRAFLMSLSDTFANEIARRYRLPQLLVLYQAMALGGLVALLILYRFEIRREVADFLRFNPGDATPGWITLVLAMGAVFGLYQLTRRLREIFFPGGRLYREGIEMRERIRYAINRKDTAEIGGQAGGAVLGRFRRARERELTERPLTISALIHDFRALAEQAGQVSPLTVIAIDELDKMSNPDRVRELLRDIKGIFEVANVHFLVSVSSEAARALDLGSIAGRDEFNSSFYTVIEFDPLSPSECGELLAKRGGDSDLGRYLGTLAGGNPRELVRVADAVSGYSAHLTGADRALQAIRTALMLEALEFRRAVVTSPSDGVRILTQDERVELFKSLPRHVFEESAFDEFARRAMDELWDAPWAQRGWEARYAESWRRLLVRMRVGRELTLHPLGMSDERLSALQTVIVATSDSGEVGRLMLLELLSEVGSAATKR